MIGKTISHYKIIGKLGKGGMGVVYKAEDTKLKRTVALKFLASQLLPTDAKVRRFVNEAQTAAALDHPNICTVYEIDTAAGHTFISMAYVPGETLENRIAAGPMEPNEVVDIAIQLCAALREAHTADVIHRDIKPANVMMSTKGPAILLDFGLAKLKSQSKLTRTGTTVGTSTYMSPEQVRGEPADQRTDIWSLGVVLYQMLTGVVPFKAEHEAAALYSIVNEDAEPISTSRPNVPVKLEKIVLKTLAKKPSERYQNVDSLLADLEVFTGVQAGEATPASVELGVEEHGRRRLYRVLAVVVIVIIAAAVAWLWPQEKTSDNERLLESETKPTQTSAPASPMAIAGQRQNSIAVLPLGNLSGDEENEFFVDGMTEEIITQLAQIKALKVISRTSIMRYRDSDKPLGEIAKELGVSTILEGSALWAGDRVRINAQLIDGTNDEHLWAKSYESDLGDVLGLQRRVANDVANQIKVELSVQEKNRLAGTPTVNREAYELYLRGRYHWNKRMRPGIQKAMDCYGQAIEKDPDYALAYAGLAESYLVLGTWGRWTPSNEIYPKAREYAVKALEIDSDLAAAHAALGGITFEYDWDWDAAESHFRRALELNPNYASAHQWYAEFLLGMGRFEEAINEIMIAKELDPLSLIFHTIAGWMLAANGEFERALAEFQTVADLDPDFPLLHNNLTYFYLRKGEKDKAAESRIRFLELTANSESEREAVREAEVAFSRSGFDGFCRFAVSHLTRRYRESYASPTLIADYFTQIGEADSAMTWLERAYEQRAPAMQWVAGDPMLVPLHSDPRFIDLLKRMDLADTPYTN